MKFTFAPESRPFDGYTIKRAIQKGGFGEVYYAVTDAGKEVALKLLQHNLEIELRGVRQCLNLKHPHLVTIFDIKQDADGDHWIVMEFVAGRTLLEVLDDHPSGLPQEEVTHWLTAIAEGLNFLHDRGLVHRDLKPANVFEDSGIVKIGDIGLSKFITESRRGEQTQSVGTVYYMAPEVSRGQYGREVDVYSLGVMLYEMLTGRLPFEGDTAGEILMKHLTEAPDLSRVQPQLRPVIAHALEKDPLRRTRTAGQLLEEYRQALDGRAPQPHAAANGSPVPRTAEQLRAEVRQAAHAHAAAPPHAQPQPAAGTTAESDQPIRDWFHKNWQYFLWGGLALMVFAPSLLASVVAMSVRLGVFAVIVGGLALLGYKIYAYIAEQETLRRQQTPPQPPPDVAAGRPPQAAPAAPIFDEPPPRRPQQSAPSRKVGKWHSPATIRVIPLRTRMMELFTSLAVAPFFATAVTLLVALTTSGLENWQTLTLFGLFTTLGSWAVLAESKFLEGRRVDGSLRRLRMLAVGCVAGAALYWLNQVTYSPIDMTYNGRDSIFQYIGPFRLLTHEQTPTLASYVVYFGLLFGLRRWWWHVDSYRRSRFSIWSLIGTGLVAFVLYFLVAFHGTWGPLWAISISAVAQLSAVWTPPEQRVPTRPAKHNSVS